MKKFKTIKIKPIKIKFNFDSDGDGVRDSKDCQPFNPKKQDWDIEEAKTRGVRIEYMHPDEYLRRTGFDERTPKDYYDKYFEKFYDMEKEKRRPISELKQMIQSPHKKITIPYVGEHPADHEGRHRAYAAKLAGQKRIPVIVPLLSRFSISEREELGKIFVKKAGLDNDPAYAHEWIERFREGKPETAMDSKNKKLLLSILEKRKRGLK